METAFKRLVRRRNTTLKKVATELDYSRVHITNVANGHPAGKKLIAKLIIWSKGQLSVSDLLDIDSLK